MVVSGHSSLLLVLLVLHLLINHLLLGLLLLELWLLELLLGLVLLLLCSIGDLLLVVGSLIHTGVLIGCDILRLDFWQLLLKLTVLQLLLLLEEHLVLLLLLLLLLERLWLLLLGVGDDGLRLVPLASKTGLLLLLVR